MVWASRALHRFRSQFLKSSEGKSPKWKGTCKLHTMVSLTKYSLSKLGNNRYGI